VRRLLVAGGLTLAALTITAPPANAAAGFADSGNSVEASASGNRGTAVASQSQTSYTPSTSSSPVTTSTRSGRRWRRGTYLRPTGPRPQAPAIECMHVRPGPGEAALVNGTVVTALGHFSGQVTTDDVIDGELIWRQCLEVESRRMTSSAWLAWGPTERAAAAVGGRPGGIDPRLLAELQVATFELPPPGVQTSPDPASPQIVRVPVWLWLDDGWETMSATATAGPVTSTVTATPTRVVWDMGVGTPWTCDNPGTPYDPTRADAAQTPSCAYTYQRTSAGEQGEVFAVSATVYWQVTWTSNLGVGGDLGELSQTTDFDLRVAQLQAINR